MLPSLPVIRTWVALVAVTVNMDEVPARIAAGLAVMPLVGATCVALKLAPPHPASSMSSKVQGNSVKRILLNDRRLSDFVTAYSFLSLTGAYEPSVLCKQMSDYQAVTFHQFISRSSASAKLSLCCELDKCPTLLGRSSKAFEFLQAKPSPVSST